MDKKIWFYTGSQHLYGDDVLKKVQSNSKDMVEKLNIENKFPLKIEFKDILTTSEEIKNGLDIANSSSQCIGVIVWMHTFSPAKMWINGLKSFSKPLMHLHTQYNRNLDWDNIDMDYMNLNQSAHGDREFGFIGSRMEISRKVVVGHWQDENVSKDIDSWIRVAKGIDFSKTLKVARFGDNMRDVAVTEGDKVEAQIKFGWDIKAFGIGDLVKYIDNVTKDEIENKLFEYSENYDGLDKKNQNILEQAKIEVGLEKFLLDGNFRAFTSNFENLYGMKQLPGLAVQNLMRKGYGFGGEGDWKTAALVAIMKHMSKGLDKGTSFMEDYTYHMEENNQMVLGAHMLEVCPSISMGRPEIKVHPLSIGRKDDPARLEFEGKTGNSINRLPPSQEIDLGVFEGIAGQLGIIGNLTPFRKHPFEDQPGKDDGAEQGGEDPDDQRGGKALDGARSEEEQDQTGKEGGQLGIENGTVGVPVTVLDGRLQILSGSQLLPDTFIDQHVGVNRHTDGEHNTGDPREGKYRLQGGEHPDQEEHVGQQGQVGHQSSAAAVVEKHVCQHHNEGDQ